MTSLFIDKYLQIIKILFYAIGVLILIWIGRFLVVKNYVDEQNGPIKQKLPRENMIIIYKKGREIKFLPDFPKFQQLKNEIENFTINIDNGYRLIPTEQRFDKLKKKGYTVELIYEPPKELKINFLTKSINIKRIFIPLSGGDFPPDSVFVYEEAKNFPHTLANTKQTKDNLLKLIESL